MSYLVLARKYRPQKFREVIGQEHITELLEKSLDSQRIAHAYLFCGPRGIGKTSCARILAKSLNCQRGPTLNPCGECSSCREIAQANSFDVLEIDGASNRGIDEIRALRENVKFAPTYGRYKIYIVDEVHMLTMEAFNALLKTLEEPPGHVKFIFATTAPNKVPSTIISRCQRFDFKRISVPTIMKTLAELCQKENFAIEEEALFAIAKSASGSLRDALSILDQLSVLSDRSLPTDLSSNRQAGINAQDVFSMLGLVETQFLFALVDCLGGKDCSGAFAVFDEIIDAGKDIRQLARDIIEHFRHLMIIKVGGKTLGKLIDYPVSTKELLLAQAEKFSLQEILRAIEILIESQDVSRIMESQRTPLEIAFAKLTYRIELNSSPVANLQSPVVATNPVSFHKSKSPMTDPLKNQKGQVDFSVKNQNIDLIVSSGASLSPDPSIMRIAMEVSLGEKKNEPQTPINVMTAEESAVGLPETAPDGVLDLEKVKRSWDAITYAVSRKKMSVATFLQEGSAFELKGTKLIIGFSKEAVFHKESLEQKDNLQLVEKVFSEKLKTKIAVEFKIIDNYKPQDHEPLVKTALETFKGKVVSKWHKE